LNGFQQRDAYDVVACSLEEGLQGLDNNWTNIDKSLSRIRSQIFNSKKYTLRGEGDVGRSSLTDCQDEVVEIVKASVIE
jgi:hypothetical protein